MGARNWCFYPHRRIICPPEAAAGLSVALAARRKGKLEVTAEEVTAKGDVETKADLQAQKGR